MKVTITTHTMPKKQIEIVDHEKIYAMLEAAPEGLLFDCTYDEGRAIDNWCRKWKGCTVRMKAVEIDGERKLYRLTIYRGELQKRRPKNKKEKK